MALVSAVITTHNRRKLLERAVKSVLTQTYENMELIIVDDASCDDTQQYCSALCRSNDGIRYIHISKAQSKGGNYARNLGIEHARGEWVAFLDDDDEWVPEKTQKQMDYLKAHPEVRAVSCDMKCIYDFGERVCTDILHLKREEGKYSFFITSWLNTTSSIMASKEALIQIGKFDEQMPALQECELSYRLCLNYEVGNVEEPLLDYYVYPNASAQITNSMEKNVRAIEIIERKYEKELAQLTPEQRKQRKLVIQSGKAMRYLRANQRAQYRETLKPILGSMGKGKKLEYISSYLLSYQQIVCLKSFLKKHKKR